ncbi:hypothetical protein EVAR_103831_1 [Eumeta japonica]|uniref:Uncharacterized protein n=1 Tax=Eumeta variegata TaxID=151549 RepID=A0A4C1S8V5_EUMVA|nr:hypothetical protein EVAR_103831_1 [Eumeta japonica]
MRAKESVKIRKNEIIERYDKRFSDNFRTNQKLFWHMVKKTLPENSETSRIHVIRDNDGQLLNKENNVKERWKNYFESVFACEDTVADSDVTATEYIIEDTNESEITMNEIIKAPTRMKVGKAAGYGESFVRDA